MEPLYTTKAAGLGLGLTLARSIIESHGGGLSVRSKPGRGAAFTTRLPAVSLWKPPLQTGLEQKL